MTDEEQEERVVLTVADAIAMLPNRESIHTFIQANYSILLGADWSSEEVRDALQKSIRIELSGPSASGMGHGLVFWRGPAEKGEWIFVETKDKNSP